MQLWIEKRLNCVYIGRVGFPTLLMTLKNVPIRKLKCFISNKVQDKNLQFDCDSVICQIVTFFI